MLTGEIILAIGLTFESVPFAPVGAGDGGAEFVGLGTSNPPVAVVGVGTPVGAVTGADGVVVTDVLKVGFAGLTGETGLVTLVGLVRLLTHESCVVSVHVPLGQVLTLVLMICPV